MFIFTDTMTLGSMQEHQNGSIWKSDLCLSELEYNFIT